MAPVLTPMALRSSVPHIHLYIDSSSRISITHSSSPFPQLDGPHDVFREAVEGRTQGRSPTQKVVITDSGVVDGEGN